MHKRSKPLFLAHIWLFVRRVHTVRLADSLRLGDSLRVGDSSRLARGGEVLKLTRGALTLSLTLSPRFLFVQTSTILHTLYKPPFTRRFLPQTQF